MYKKWFGLALMSIVTVSNFTVMLILDLQNLKTTTSWGQSAIITESLGVGAFYLLPGLAGIIACLTMRNDGAMFTLAGTIAVALLLALYSLFGEGRLLGLIELGVTVLYAFGVILYARGNPIKSNDKS